MTELINIYRHSTTNIGDLFSAPSLYFPDLRNITIFDIWKDDFYKIKNQLHNKIVILGGGGLISNDDFTKNIDLIVNAKPKYLIIWGAGHNTHNGSQIVYPEYIKKFDLIGIRDFNVNNYQWVPCSSCMHPLFNQVYNTIQPIVVYEHKNYPLNINLYPKMNNRGNDIGTVLKFLGSGEIVITNTYHGAYWATLLNKKVIVIDPFSTKFLGLKYKPKFADLGKYEEKLGNLVSYPYALEDSRQANIDFYRQFKHLIA